MTELDIEVLSCWCLGWACLKGDRLPQDVLDARHTFYRKFTGKPLAEPVTVCHKGRAIRLRPNRLYCGYYLEDFNLLYWPKEQK